MNEEIKLEYMHLCDYVCPAVNGKINFIGVFESFFMQKESSKVADFYIAFNITVKNKIDYKISIEIESIKDNEKIFVDSPIIITKDAPTLAFNVVKQMKDITFKNFGDYKIIIKVNNLIFNKIIKVLQVKIS